MSANSESIGLAKGELETPALCLDIEAYERNVGRMAGFIIGECGVAWRPHMKGQKAPELALRAVAAGAIGVTCATVYEAEAMAAAGVREILIAHEITGARKCDRLARLQNVANVISSTDSVDHARQLSEAAVRGGVTIPVLVEVDVGMGRCGIAPGEPAVNLAKWITTARGLRLAGIMGWEGHTIKYDPAEKEQQIRASMTTLVSTAELCRAAGLSIGIVSAAGSGTFLHSCRMKGITEVQAGGGVFSDLSYQKWGLAEHDFALTVLARAVSRPSPVKIIVDAGFKALSFQHGYPKALGMRNVKSIVLSAEHGTIELDEPSVEPRVGDVVEFVPGYTDSTLCLHDEMCVLRDGRVEAVWTIPGRGGRR